MYLTYDEFTKFGGVLDKTAFDNLEYKSEKLLNEFCMEEKKGKIKNLSLDDAMWDIIKHFVFEAVNKLNDIDNVTSIKNLDLSVTLQPVSYNKNIANLYDLFVIYFPIEWVNICL